MNNWVFDIEGVDCSGKATLVKKLVRLLKNTPELESRKIISVDFPQYDTPTGRLIKNYLNGDMPEPQEYSDGDTMELRSWKMASNMSWIAELFMLNRSAYFAEHPLEYDAIYIFDRYAYSNVIHQFAKLTDYLETPDAVAAMYATSKRKYPNESIDRICDKYKLCAYHGIVDKWLDMEWMVSPKPDRVFVLNVPAEVIHSRLRSRKVAKHEGDDILEKDAAVNRSINFVSWWYSMVKSMELDDDKLWFVDYVDNDMLKTIYEHILKDMHIATRS